MNGRTTQTYIIRLWSEHPEPCSCVWRGSVEHVQANRLIYFQTVPELCTKLTELIDIESPLRRRQNHDSET